MPLHQAKTAGRAISQEEGDYIAAMVLAVVREVIYGHRVFRADPIPGVEPTGVTVAPEMRPFVEQRQAWRAN